MEAMKNERKITKGKIQNYLIFAKDIEITLEANPGTVEQSRFIGFKQAGIICC